MSEHDEVLIPATLGEMLEKVLKPLEKASNEGWADYVRGWIRGRAEEEYKTLAVRERHRGSPVGQVTKLLCELAVARAIIRWHEVKDEPPPKPEIRSLDLPI
jgi:hypothetical protein